MKALCHHVDACNGSGKYIYKRNNQIFCAGENIGCNRLQNYAYKQKQIGHCNNAYKKTYNEKINKSAFITFCDIVPQERDSATFT